MKTVNALSAENCMKIAVEETIRFNELEDVNMGSYRMFKNRKYNFVFFGDFF